MRYKISLLCINRSPPKRLTSDFFVEALSREDAAIFALKRVKKRVIYAKSESVREYITALEIWNTGEKVGNSPNCAGFEFDALPNVLKKVLMHVSLIK